MSIKKPKSKKNKFILSNKVQVRSAHELNTDELEKLRSRFSIIGNKEMELIIDPALIAGLIIQSGTKQIDMSLSGGLQNLKNYIYERN